MSNKNYARRTVVKLYFKGADISKELSKYLLSLSFTDKEEDETDDISLSLDDREGKWIKDWLNTSKAVKTKTETVTTGGGEIKVAVEMALGGIHPKSEIEEWFDYGGKPYRFRIVLDTTESRVAADYDEIIKTVDIYKRLTAHLDGLYYQGSITVVVMPKTEFWLYSVPMTGQLKAGTEPHRNTVGAVENTVIDVMTQAAGYTAEFTPTGTKPDRNITFATKDTEIVTESDTMGYQYTSNQTGQAKAGTIPQRNTAGGVAQEGITAQATGQAYKFDSELAGTKPDRNIQYQTADVAAVGETEVQAYPFESIFVGTAPDRAVTVKDRDIQTVADTETEQYPYETDMTGQKKTGTEPYTNTKPGISDKGMATTAETESYQYEVKRCGKNRL